MNLKILIIFFIIGLSLAVEAQVSALFNVSPTHGCGTLTVSITNQSLPVPIDTLIINYDDGQIDTVINPLYNQNFNHTYNSTGSFAINLTAIKGVNSSHTQKQVQVYDFPNSNVTYGLYGYPGVLDTFYYSNRRYLFTADYENDTTHQWWIDGSLQSVHTNHLVFNFKNAGNYTVKHKINQNGCADSTKISLTVVDSEEKIPNVFTPNGDGNNDIFYIQTDGNTKYKFTVFNRHGNRVFVQEGTVISWDGYTYWGELLTSGNYYYVLEPEQGEAKRGFVFLSR